MVRTPLTHASNGEPMGTERLFMGARANCLLQDSLIGRTSVSGTGNEGPTPSPGYEINVVNVPLYRRL